MRERLAATIFDDETSVVADFVGLLFDIAVGIELFEVGPQVADLLFVLDAGEDHFGARDFGLGIFCEGLELRLGQ
jgi:hypothetical protein